MPTERSYGAWESPVSAELISSRRIRIGDVAIDGAEVYWTESRPLEKGRFAIVRRNAGGEEADLIAAPFNARNRIHEYGGAAFAVFDGTAYFTNYSDQRLYRVRMGEEPLPLTTVDDVRHGDMVLDRTRNRLIAVREDTLDDGPEPRNAIAAVPLDGPAAGESRIIVSGADFYSNPRISPDGTQLVWLAWNHPNMPWDGTELWIGSIDDRGEIVDATMLAGGPQESIFQPEWGPDGSLFYVSDRTGWWNLYRHDDAGGTNLRPESAEYGGPAWVLGASTYAIDAEGTIFAAVSRGGTWSLTRIDPDSGTSTPFALPSTDFSRIRAGSGVVIAVVASPVEASAVITINTSTSAVTVLRQSVSVNVDRGYLSIPGAVTFPTSDGQIAHGFFYPPQNNDFQAPKSELPPLIVESHGGPTGSTGTGLDLALQFWTSRGFAVLDVNYRGSTGYGRPYRDALQNTWGIYDVDDCVYGAKHLAEEGLVDPDRLLIHGWSASGFTTLAALTFRDAFRAGASHYGISDLEAMVRDTHKFESRYLDGLVGPWPEAKAIYDERSPILHVDQISSPLILFQGTEDKVVPPNQAEMMFEAADARGLPVAMLLFEGEQHGFRQSQNIQRALEAELYFYGRILGFTPAGSIEPVEIRNLPGDS